MEGGTYVTLVGTVRYGGDFDSQVTVGSGMCVLQCVAVCCSVLHCVAVFGSVLQRKLRLALVCVCVAVCQCVAVCRIVLQCVAAFSYLHGGDFDSQVTVGSGMCVLQCVVCVAACWLWYECVLQCVSTRKVRLALVFVCDAVCCSVLQCDAGCCRVLQRGAASCSVCGTLETKLTTHEEHPSDTLQHLATYCNTHYSTLQHTATHCHKSNTQSLQ